MSPVELRFPQLSPLDEPEGTLSNAVAGLASERGVSERTVWRWVAAIKAGDPLEIGAKGRTCRRCQRPLPTNATMRRRYCDEICRVYAWREQRASDG